MSPSTVVEIGRQAVEVMLLLSAPLFIAALATGLLISIFQAATQINEATLSFVPKILAAVATLAIGLLDGFNPCAMWVLLFLLSLLVTLRDRFAMALIAGTFVLVEGIAYFVFMAAWLNLFLFIGLSLAGVDDYWQMFAAGCLVIIAVALDQWLRRASQ